MEKEKEKDFPAFSLKEFIFWQDKQQLSASSVVAEAAGEREWRTSTECVVYQKARAQLLGHLRAVAIFKYNTGKKHGCLQDCTVRTVKIYPQIGTSD